MQYKDTDINRFLEAQDSPYSGYDVALREIKASKKYSHWIWYIFPQFRAFAHSATARYYGITDKREAEAYIQQPILNQRLREITEALLQHADKTPIEIFGQIDSGKVRSCMTMFDYLSPNDIYGKVLDTFYAGVRGGRTLRELGAKRNE